jgi:hypothetical protein
MYQDPFWLLVDVSILMGFFGSIPIIWILSKLGIGEW